MAMMVTVLRNRDIARDFPRVSGGPRRADPLAAVGRKAIFGYGFA
ncbi:hypothetical protein [Herbidospora mongoliensis]|nr:hypothetical protein [Herbidospora mongoliensis]